MKGIFLSKESRLVTVCLFFLLALTIVHPALAQGQGATLRLDPDPVEIGEGQVETVNIVLENAQNVYGIDVRLSFDPALVEVVDADPAAQGIQLIPGSFVKPDFVVRNTADNQTGKLQYAATQVNPSVPANGTGVIFSFMMRGKVQGKQSVLKIDAVEMADGRGNVLPVTLQSGTVNVVAPKPPTPTPQKSSTPTTSPLRTLDAPSSPATPTLSKALAASATSTTPVKAPASSSDSMLAILAVAGGASTIVLLAVVVLLLRRKPSPPNNGSS